MTLGIAWPVLNLSQTPAVPGYPGIGSSIASLRRQRSVPHAAGGLFKLCFPLTSAPWVWLPSSGWPSTLRLLKAFRPGHVMLTQVAGGLTTLAVTSSLGLPQQHYRRGLQVPVVHLTAAWPLCTVT